MYLESHLVAQSNATCLTGRKAAERGRIPKDMAPTPVGERCSRLHAGLMRCSPWLRAQADVYHMILEHAKSSQSQQSAPHCMLADLSQSTDRGQVTLDGSLGVVTTGSLWYSYSKLGSLSAEDYMRLLGFQPSDMQYDNLTTSELRELAGNGMRSQMLIKLFLPVLKCLKYLEPHA